MLSLPAAIVGDLRHGLRLLRRQPGFTATAVITLALATGAAAAIFSVVDAALLNPLPYPHPEQLFEADVETVYNGEVHRGLAPSLDDVRAWNDDASPLRQVAVERSVYPERVFDAGVPEHLPSVRVSERYLPLLGIAPAIGRAFTAADTARGAPATVMLSHGYWMSRFGGDESVLDRPARYNGGPATIIGVLPPGFGESMPIWNALQMPADQQNRRGTGWRVVGRLKEGVSVEMAADRLKALAAPEQRGQSADAIRLTSTLDSVRGDYRKTVGIIAGAVGIIVLIACVNIAGLLLARGESRQAELAVRAAMGAGRGAIVRQLLTESLLLSAIGGAAGLLLAALTLQTIVANIPLDLPGDAPPAINRIVLAGTLAVTAINGLLFGLIPALRLSRTSGSRALTRAGRQHATGLSRRGGQALIAVEIALAVVMLAGAGLMVRSFVRLLGVDLGFDPARALTLKVEPLDQTAATAGRYYPALVERIRRLPGVEAVGAVDYAPLSDGLMMTAAKSESTAEPEMIQVQTTIPGYFETMGLAPAQGRVFADSDLAGPGRVVLNVTAAKTFFPNGPAVGQRLQVWKSWLDVVGVVPDARHYGPQNRAAPAVYLMLRPGAEEDMEPTRLTVVVRPRPGAVNVVRDLQDTAKSIGVPVILDGVRSGTDWLGDRVNVPRQRTVLLTLLGALGLLLSVVGVLGVTAYAVGRRTQEIGIRLALGARAGQVVGRVLAEAALPILIGVVAGTLGALAATRAIRTFLFQTSPTDAGTLATVAVLLAIVGVFAAWIPARRAARVDPVTALRAE